jgi:hypothetical protein
VRVSSHETLIIVPGGSVHIPLPPPNARPFATTQQLTVGLIRYCMLIGVALVALAVAFAAAAVVWPAPGGGFKWVALYPAFLPSIMGPAFIWGSLYLRRFGPGSQLIVKGEVLVALREAVKRSPARIQERSLARNGDKAWRPLTGFVLTDAGNAGGLPVLTIDLYEARGEAALPAKALAAKLKIAPPLLMVLIDRGAGSDPVVTELHRLAAVYLFGVEEDQGR